MESELGKEKNEEGMAGMMNEYVGAGDRGGDKSKHD